MAEYPKQHTVASAYQRQSCPAASARENISALEKALSMAAGGALLIYGLKKAGVGSVLGMLVGGALLYRGSTGYCPTYDMLGIDTHEPHLPSTPAAPQKVKGTPVHIH